MGSRSWSLGIVALLALAGCPWPDDDAPHPPPDAGPDASRPPDAGRRDAGRRHDAFVEESCTVGTPCDPDRGCTRGECIRENVTVVSGGCEPDVTTVFWRGGYCVPALPTRAMLQACDPNDPEACPSCSTCTAVGGGQTVCMADCEPTADTNGGCRDGYECQLGSAVCMPGCTSDADCRVFEGACDSASEATCNPVTFRCDQPSGGGAAGSPCTRAAQCEADGTCIAAWPGGYCSKLGCDVAGRECAGDGKCQLRRVGRDLCGQPCQVWEEDGTPEEVGPMGHATDCREGYSCAWDGINGAGVEGNGICVPGTYNDVMAPNVGAPCDAEAVDNTDCYSPFGAGLCIGGAGTVWGPDNYCTVLDCAAPGAPTDICGAGASCVVLFNSGVGTTPDLGACLKDCTTAADCNRGNACLPEMFLIDGGRAQGLCFPACNDDAQCGAGYMCDAAPMMFGNCVPM